MRLEKQYIQNKIHQQHGEEFTFWYQHTISKTGPIPHWIAKDSEKGAYDIPEVHGAFIAWLELTGKGKSSVIDLMVVSKSYGWAMSTDGEVYGLIAGDQGFEKTGIQLSGTDLEIWKLGIEQHDAIEDKLDECNK
ncbi:conserved hypothetical protein [Vibrio chagasii]|uniref:hypothetical protein n=1 Tax=Vibrio fortis TaxID=212667 RepID=UPI00336C7C44|nr:conserved hypothetical protein [Vibrio chagasii]CAH7369403.1 conserved hypothetical protein [Vibrio chagasii]